MEEDRTSPTFVLVLGVRVRLTTGVDTSLTRRLLQRAMAQWRARRLEPSAKFYNP